MELLVLLSPSALDPYKENSDLMIQSRRSTKIGTFCQFNDILCCGHCSCKQAVLIFMLCTIGQIYRLLSYLRQHDTEGLKQPNVVLPDSFSLLSSVSAA